MIFVVEDDAPTRDSLCLLFDCEGIACRGFASAEDFFAASPPLAGACVISDVHMPGMSGVDLLERLRARGESVPVVLVTGQSSPSLVKRAAANGVTAVLDKPFDIGALVERIRGLLDGSHPPA